MINITNLDFSYRKDRKLFEKLSWKIEPGYIYGLLGKNGAGKTTLMKLISGLLKPDSGIVDVNGYKPFGRMPDFLGKFVFIPEEFSVPPMRIEGFVNNYSPFYENFDRDKFLEYLKEFEVDTATNPLLSSLSYGQKKKVLISFAFASGTPLLILDEPTNGLDIPSKAVFRKLCIDALSGDRTFIISTHQVKDVERILDKITILDKGKIISDDSVENISTKYECKFQEQLPQEGVLYYEKTLGGYKTIALNTSGSHSALDIELYFNAMIKQNS